MSKRDVILFLFKWKYTLIGYFVFVVVAATLLVYLLPQKYDTNSKILVESNRSPVMRSDAAFGTDEMFALNSAIAIISSHTVLSSAVDKVGAGDGGRPPGTFARLMDAVFEWMEDVGLREPLTPRAGLIRRLEKNLEVEPVPNSNVITISLSDANPRWATDMVNAVTDSYIEHHLEVFSSKGTADVYGRQVDRLAQELEERRDELADYKRRSSVSALNETRQALVRLQGQLMSELTKTREELTELRTRFSPGHTKITLTEEKLDNTKKSLDETQAKLQRLEEQQARIEEMQLGINSIEKSYQEYQKRYEEARLNDLANPDVVNVRVIEYAEVPTRPGHSRIFYILLAAAGGFLLSLGIALIKEYFDHRVTDPDDVSKLLGIPTLGSVERAGAFF